MKVLKKVEFGIYMDGGEGLEVLMPSKYVPHEAKVGDVIRCFVYQDAEARLIATTEHPIATVGQCGYLKCTMVTKVGAFCDWGTSKELLVPHREQTVEMQEGRSYLIYIYVDHVSGRIVGTAHLDKMLDNVPPKYERGDEVEAIVWKQTPLGWKVIVDHEHTGMVYSNQIYREIHTGDSLRAWVNQVREDDKIDLMLQPIGYRAAYDANEAQLLRALNLCHGYLPLTDKTDPAIIASQLHMSKRNFKQAVGGLYKKGRITILPAGIELKEEKK